MDRGLPAGSESAFNAGYPGSVPGLQRSPAGEQGITEKEMTFLRSNVEVRS